ncbi:MAG: restriction endonuclease [Corallococcus sp.]|nr:restriction endonuclease [Corallococcus sp.]
MKNENKGIIGKIILCALIAVVGLGLVVAAFVVPEIYADDMLKWIVIGLGAVIAVACIIAIVVLGKKAAKLKEQQSDAINLDAGSIDPTAANAHAMGSERTVVNYIPNQNAYDFVNQGEMQSMESKFEQIGKMERTQFVIYIAKLFSHKGYEIKFTPVVDNHGVDMIAEKNGTSYALYCLHSQKISSAEDISPVVGGKKFYNTSNAMVITNMFFDKTAVEYARSEKVSLIDRAILIDDFM